MPDLRSPQELRRDISEEVVFWTRILMEHTMFMKLGLPNSRPDLVQRAESFQSIFSALYEEARRGPITSGFIARVRREVVSLIEFKEEILILLVQCQLGGTMLYPLLMNHLIREARHFIEVLDSDGSFNFGNRHLNVMRQEVFWLRIMKEHPEFVMHLLDPSERVLFDTAQSFYRTFQRLLESGCDLQSMAESNPPTFSTIGQFTDVVRNNTVGLRDFKAQGYELARLCRLLSIVPSPILMDHIRREADKFLSELDIYRRQIGG